MDLGNIAKPHSIASSFSVCVTLFRDLLLALEGCSLANEIPLPEVCDEYGRLNVWGAKTGALRGSLDEILQNEEKLHSAVSEISTGLINSLKRANKLISSNIASANDQESYLDESDEDSLSIISSSSEKSYVDIGMPRPKNSKIQHLISIILKQIRLLYKIPMLPYPNEDTSTTQVDSWLRSEREQDLDAELDINQDGTTTQRNARSISDLPFRPLDTIDFLLISDTISSRVKITRKPAKMIIRVLGRFCHILRILREKSDLIRKLKAINGGRLPAYTLMGGVDWALIRRDLADPLQRMNTKILVIGRLCRIFLILRNESGSIKKLKSTFGPRLPPNMLMISGKDIRKAVSDLGALHSGREQRDFLQRTFPNVILLPPVLGDRREPLNFPLYATQKEDRKRKPGKSKLRTWHDRSGSFNVEAQFLGLTNNKLRLHKANGFKITVPIEKMSIQDLEYLETITGDSFGELAEDSESAKSTIKPRTRKITDYFPRSK